MLEKVNLTNKTKVSRFNRLCLPTIPKNLLSGVCVQRQSTTLGIASRFNFIHQPKSWNENRDTDYHAIINASTENSRNERGEEGTVKADLGRGERLS